MGHQVTWKRLSFHNRLSGYKKKEHHPQLKLETVFFGRGTKTAQHLEEDIKTHK